MNPALPLPDFRLKTCGQNVRLLSPVRLLALLSCCVAGLNPGPAHAQDHGAAPEAATSQALVVEAEPDAENGHQTTEAANEDLFQRRKGFLKRALLFSWERDSEGATVAVLKRGGVVLGQEELDALHAPEPEQPERGSLVPMVVRTVLLALPLPLPLILIPTCGVAGLVVGLVTWALVTLAVVAAGAPSRLLDLGGAAFLPHTQTWSVFGGLLGVAAAAVLMGAGGLVTVLSGWISTLNWVAVPSHTWAQFARLHNTRLAVEMGLTRKTLPPQYFPH